MLTDDQKREFVENGYIKIPGAVPMERVEAARRAINHSIGNVGMGGEDPSRNRGAFYCAELLDAPVILDLFRHEGVMGPAEDLMGKGKVLPVERAKPYPRFPLPLGEEPAEPNGHIDGTGSGTNGTAKGDYKRTFAAFAVVYLMDVPKPYSGNFTVWPKSHRAMGDHFQKHGHQVLSEGTPRIDMSEPPLMVTGKAGDLILAHCAMLHGACQNGAPDVRHAVIARLKHLETDALGVEGYMDIWREWEGVQGVLETA